jgi:uncharacterized protein YcfL
MKKIVFALLSVLVFLGCSSKSASDVEIESKLVVNNSLEKLALSDQHAKPTPITKRHKRLFSHFLKMLDTIVMIFLQQKMQTS